MQVYNPHRHHRIVPILGLAIGTPVFLAGLFLLIVNIGWHDEARPNDSTLVLTSVHVVDADNAYIDLQSANAAAILAEPNATEPRQDTMVEEMVAGSAWDADYATATIATYRSAIDLFRAAAKTTVYQDPTTADVATISVNSGIADLSEIRFVAYHTALEAIAKARAKDVAGGLAEATDVTRVGWLMQGGQNSFITYLVAASIEHIGLSALRTIASDVGLTADQALRVSTELEQYRDSTAGLVNALKVEYMVGRSYQSQFAHLDGLYNAFNLYIDANGQALPEAPGSWFPRLLDRSGIMGFYYMPNQTWRWRVEETARNVALASADCSTMTEADTQQQLLPGFQLSYFWTPNVIGKVVHDIGQVSYGGLTTKRCNVSLDVSATQALLGLSAYRTDTKGLPTALNQLVPKYLVAVPADPYSENALRYDAATGTVYSVGVGHIDLGGSPVSSDWQTEDNPSFSLQPST